MSVLSTVAVMITANIAQLRSGLEEARNRLDTFGNSARNNAASFATVGKTAGIAATAMAAGLGYAVKTAADFDSEMSNVKALSGATDEQFKQLRDTAIDLGSKSVYSASEAAKGMSILSAAGFNSQQVIAAMPGLLDAAAASGEDFANVSDIMVSSMSGFGLEASDMGHIADVLASAANASSISISDIGYSLKYVAPVAKTAGLSIEEVSSALAILGNSGIKADQAGTSLRTSLTNLAVPSKAAAEMMQALGLNVIDSQGKMLPLKELIGQLQEKFSTLSQAEKMNAASTIFGTESMSAMLTLIDAGPEKLDELTQSFKSSDGAANKMATTMTDNFNGSLGQLGGAVESALISIGTALIPTIRAIADGVSTMVNWFNALPEPVRNNLAIFGAITTVLTLFSAGILILIGLIPSVIVGLSALTTIGSVLAGVIGLITGPVALVIAGIVALIAIGVLLYKNWDTIKEYASKTWKEISSLATSTWNGIKTFLTNTWQSISKTVSSTIDAIKGFFTTGFKAVSNTVSSIWGQINGVFTAYTGTIKALITAWWELLKTTTSTVFLAIYYLITGQWDKIGDVFTNASKKIKDTLDTFWKTITQLWTNAFNQLLNTASIYGQV